MKKKRRSYREEVDKLCRAIDIAIDTYKSHPPPEWTIDNINFATDMLEKDKSRRINCEPRFRSLASLKYDIDAVFTYFQEATGNTVEYFWKKIKEENLDYKRVNKLEKIFKRGKIRGRIEYEYSKDIIVVAQQTGMITEKEAKKLGGMIHQFEFR